MKIIIGSKKVKPTLRGIVGLTCITAAAVFGLIALGNNPVRPVCVLLAVYFLVVLVLLVRAFIQQLEYNLYSYNVIYYSGFALFVLFIFVASVINAVPILTTDTLVTADAVIMEIVNSAKTYTVLTAPIILVFSISLLVSNVELIRREGGGLKNLLGILLAVAMIGGWVFVFLFDYAASGSEHEVMMHTIATNVMSVSYMYMECMLVGTVIAIEIAARYEPPRDRDFMVILGCGIDENGNPRPLLRGRIDRALEFGRKQKEETGKEIIYVTSGGQGPDEVISESEAMKRYLMSKGIPESRILKEDRSTSTLENMKFSREKILAVNENPKTAFSTTNFHVFRSGGLARKVRLRAYGVGAKTRWYFWPNASVRELLGLLAERPVKTVSILIVMILVYTVLTVLAFN